MWRLWIFKHPPSLCVAACWGLQAFEIFLSVDQSKTVPQDTFCVCTHMQKVNFSQVDGLGTMSGPLEDIDTPAIK